MSMKKNNKKLSGDLLLISNYMDRIIDGDYSPVDVDTFEVPALGEKFNDMITSFKKSNNNFVMRLNQAMEHIADSSCVKEMIEEVTSQNSSILEMKSSSHELEDSINDISSAVENIKENTSYAMSVSEKSVDNMNSTIHAVSESAQQINSINEKVQDFNEKTAKITEIIDIVKKIANRSGLLALNASIEAARAGEVGRGFAVVANQVKQLSNNTTESAETVVQYVNELQSSIAELVVLVDDTTKNLENGTKKVQQSVTDMKNMSEHIVQINAGVNDIYNSVNTQTSVTNSFVQSVASMAKSYNVIYDDCANTGTHMYRINRFIDTARSDMARGFSELTLQDWIKVFQIDHLIFTWRVYNNLAGFEQLKIEQLNNPKGCKLGKWAASQTDPRIIGNPAFKDVLKYHEDIHKHACDSWQAAKKNDRSAALECFNRAYNSYQSFYTAIMKFKDYLKTIGYTDETVIKVFRN